MRVKLTNKIFYICFYSVFIFIPVWAGGKLINLALDQIFISRFVVGWQQVARRLEERVPQLPPMQNQRLVAGMNKIERLAALASITLPVTKTKHSYTYLLKKINQPVEKIFLAVEPTRIIIYGLRKQTMQRIDKHIDGTENIHAGNFQAIRGKDKGIYIGILQL